jgi:hypothetical protein
MIEAATAGTVRYLSQTMTDLGRPSSEEVLHDLDLLGLPAAYCQRHWTGSSLPPWGRAPLRWKYQRAQVRRAVIDHTCVSWADPTTDTDNLLAVCYGLTSRSASRWRRRATTARRLSAVQSRASAVSRVAARSWASMYPMPSP